MESPSNETRSPDIQTAAAVMTSFATVAVVLRLLSRRISAWSYCWEDLFIVLALVSRLSKVDIKQGPV